MSVRLNPRFFSWFSLEGREVTGSESEYLLEKILTFIDHAAPIRLRLQRIWHFFETRSLCIRPGPYPV